MLKKLLIGIAALVLFLAIAVVVLPLFIPLDLVKDFATTKIGEAIHREVKVGKVSFNLFKGFELKDLYVGNRDGFSKDPFIAAESIELKYSFWSIFIGKLLINEISLIKPQILIEENFAGETNYGDLVKTKTAQRQTPNDSPNAAAKRQTQPPVSLLISSFSIKDGRLILKNPNETNEAKNFNLSASGITLVAIKPAKLDASATILYQGKPIAISLSSRIGINLAENAVKIPALSLSIAGEELSAIAEVTKLDAGPSISFSANSNKFSVEPFVGLFAGAKTPKKLPYGALTAKVNKSLNNLSPNLAINGNFDIKNLSFRDLSLDKVSLKLAVVNKTASLVINEISGYGGALTAKATINLIPGLSYHIEKAELKNFNATPFTNALVDSFLSEIKWSKGIKNKIEGTLSAKLSARGRGIEAPDIIASLNGSAVFSLKGGKIHHPKALEAVADKINWPGLKNDLTVSELKGEASMARQVVTVKDFSLNDTDIKLKFAGGIDLNNQVYVPGNNLTLILSPAVVQKLPPEFKVLADKDGRLNVDVELGGSLALPFPTLKLARQVEIVQGKIRAKIDAKKIEIEEGVKEEAAKKVEELKEEAGKKLKELLKF